MVGRLSNRNRRQARTAHGTDEEPPPPPPLVPGIPSAVSPLVRRIVAPNPGPMTGPGTNTYLVGIDEVVVVDPGPDDPAHRKAIVGASMRDRVVGVVVTHLHADHAAGARALAEATGSEVYALAPRGSDLVADRQLADGMTIDGSEFRLEVLHTPGHAPEHVCLMLEEERLLFTGDTVLEGMTPVISPKLGGDMAVYLESLLRLQRQRAYQIAPGHGYVIEDPAATIEQYLAHRAQREAEILDALDHGPAKIAAIVEAVYPEIGADLADVAAAQVHAHLLKLRDEGRVEGRAVRSAWRTAA